jgi:predicted nucleic acid-binding protein
MSDTASIPAPVAAEPPHVVPATGLFDSIDWKNPVPAVIKLATHLHSLDMLTSAERLTMLQGSLLYVINTSTMSELEKDAARVFVSTMVPHVVETAVSGIEAVAKVAVAEKKLEAAVASALSKQPEIVVKTMEAVLADAAKTKWRCW